MLDKDRDLEQYEEESIDNSSFVLSKLDWSIIEAAKLMLWKMVRAPQIKPKELIGISKALYVLERLPKVTDDVDLNIGISSPYKWYNNQRIFRYWTVEITGEELHVCSGGSHYTEEVGSDSFTSFSWWAQPGHEAIYDDYTSQHWMIPELDDFISEIESLDLVTESYEFAVVDHFDQFDLEDEFG